MTINKRNFLLASASVVLLGCLGMASGALADQTKYKAFYKASDTQGFYFEEDTQETVGFITSLKIGDKVYPKDLRLRNPLDVKGEKLDVVGVVTGLAWYKADDAIFFKARVPSRSRQQAGFQIYKLEGQTKDLPVEFGFVIYQYDEKTKKHYKRFHSGNHALKGNVEKRRDEIEPYWFEMDPSPSETVPSPRNYELSVSALPHTEAQELNVATSSDNSTVEKWGPR